MKGKRLVIASEVEDGAQFDEARLKSITGGDELSARKLYHDYSTFTPVCKIWLALNHLPEVSDYSDAFWRRVRAIPFTEGSTHHGKQTLKLSSTASAMASWLGWLKAASNGKPTGSKTPKAVLQASEDYRLDSDPLADFLLECCELGECFSVPGGVLYGADHAWRLRAGLSFKETLVSSDSARRPRTDLLKFAEAMESITQVLDC